MHRAEVFAEHAALAIEFARAREDKQRLAVLEDRDRIAPAEMTPHSGLANMDERATRWGGEFDVRSEAGSGLSLRWTIPLATNPS